MPHRFFKATAKYIEEKINPRIGMELLSLASNNFAVRYDRRTPSIVHDAGGFKPRIPPENIGQITRNCVEKYQEYNINPFGIGTCLTYPDLEQGYVEGNPSHAAGRTLFGLYAPAVSMNLIRQRLIGEVGDRSYENEYIVLDRVPFSRILFATTPDYREAFKAGVRVPNEVAQFQQIFSLPSTFNIEDARDVSSVFRWLLKHDAEEAAKSLCAFVFANLTAPALAYRLNHDKTLISATQLFLRDQETPSPRSSDSIKLM